MKERYSNRFKTESDKEWHQKTQFESMEEVDKDRLFDLKKRFPQLSIKNLNRHTFRLELDGKKLDLYERRFFKVNSNKRGDYNKLYEDVLIKEYFDLKT